MCDEKETSGTENSMETDEKLSTIESELDSNGEEENIINKRSRPEQKRKKLSFTAKSVHVWKSRPME